MKIMIFCMYLFLLFSTTIVNDALFVIVYFVAITVRFGRSTFSMNENGGSQKPYITLNKPLHCCSVSLLLEVRNDTAESKYST